MNTGGGMNKGRTVVVAVVAVAALAVAVAVVMHLASDTTAPPNAPTAPLSADAALPHPLYRQCMLCHGEQGEGTAGNAPALTAAVLTDEVRLVRAILKGAPRSGRYQAFMPPYAGTLDDAQVAELASWLRQRHGGGGQIAPAVVTAERNRR
jgi:mono/diheme cytochrome c family protein